MAAERQPRVAHFLRGMTRDLPSRIIVPERPLAFWMADTEVPYLEASPDSVSPFLMVWRTVFGVGFGLGLLVVFATVDLGLVVVRAVVLREPEEPLVLAFGRELVLLATSRGSGFGALTGFGELVGFDGGRMISGDLPGGRGVMWVGTGSFFATAVVPATSRAG